MRTDHHRRGGAAIGVLNCMEPWEARLILNLRRWCEGIGGKQEICSEYCAVLTDAQGEAEAALFDELLQMILSSAFRPLVRHSVDCTCLGADEGIFANLVRTASEGHLNDAALIATLIVGPGRAEHVAILAAHVGDTLRRMHDSPNDFSRNPVPGGLRLH